MSARSRIGIALQRPIGEIQAMKPVALSALQDPYKMSFRERTKMLEYRLTKYDPVVRREGRRYTEWTSFSEVGATFDGKVLTQSAYERVESAYIAAATAFLREAGADSVSIRGLENQKGERSSYAEGDVLAPKDVEAIMAMVLREKLWCRLEGERGFVHFGWDYYMYVGVASACPEAQRLAAKLGLFVEEMQSPYHPHPE